MPTAEASGRTTPVDAAAVLMTLMLELRSGASLIVGVATGPMWLTYHPRAKHAERITLLDHERVEIFGHEHHCRSVAQAEQLLFAQGWI